MSLLVACTVRRVCSFWYVVAHGVLDLSQHRAFQTGHPLSVAVCQWLNVVFIVSFSVAVDCGTKVLDLRFGCATNTKVQQKRKGSCGLHTCRTQLCECRLNTSFLVPDSVR